MTMPSLSYGYCAIKTSASNQELVLHPIIWLIFIICILLRRIHLGPSFFVVAPALLGVYDCVRDMVDLP